jgi:4-hydroxy-tetrahydrodipicolinate reductase
VIPVSVHGAEGRMGLLITDLVASAADMELAGLVSEPGREKSVGEFHPTLPLIDQNRMAPDLPGGVVIIDFSLAVALDGLLDQARLLKAPLVVGTTGFSSDQQEKLRQYSLEFPVVQASNFSVGIPALQMLLQLLARTLPPGFNAEQVETHHITKLDKPSGTARTLADTYTEVRGGESPPTHSQRLGGVIGEHTWTFSDLEETVVLTHRAHSRQAFLRGILPSVRFVYERETGLYDLIDVLKGLADPA